MSRLLITIGVVFIVLGVLWPLLGKLGLGRLPGDISIHKDNFTFYFPIATSIVVSIVLTVILWLIGR